MTEQDTQVHGLPKGWIWTHVGDLVEFQYGKALTESKRELNGIVPVYGSNGIVGHHTSALTDKPSVIVGRKGAAGEVHLAKIPCWAIDTTYYVYPPEGIELGFLYYTLRFLKLNSLDRSTAIPGLNRNDAYSLNIPLPPLSEQHRIVTKIEELFTRLDDGVAELKKVLLQLKRYRQSVLKSAFNGSLTAEWRQEHQGELEPASVLLERIKTERKKSGKYKELPSLDTKDLPELPEGWVWTRVGEFSDLIHYGFTASSTPEPIGPKMLRITDIQNNYVDWNTVPYCEIDNEKKLNYLLKSGDLVFARTGATVGKSYLIKGIIPEAVFASYLIRMVLSDYISKEYVSAFFQSGDYWMQISQKQLGIGQPNVNSQILAHLTVPLAPLLEQQKIVDEIERCFSVADETAIIIEQSLKQAERLRQSILKRTFEGKLVPQDSDDEPADKLLERIKVEKLKTQANAKRGRAINVR